MIQPIGGWYPISEAHEDHGECVWVNMSVLDYAPYPITMSTLDIHWSRRSGDYGFTHFYPIKLSHETADRLIAAMALEEL